LKLSNVQDAIKKLKDRVNKIPELIEESCQKIATKASADAPDGTIVTASGNTVRAVGNLAAYREFGTGRAAAAYIPANLPIHWDEYAYSFYKTGEGKIKETPFLFPAYETERVELINNIKKLFGNGQGR
jgi:hypothetical protein